MDRRVRSLRCVLLALVICSAQPASSSAAPGDLDPTFQGGNVDPGLEAKGLALTPTGEAVVTGTDMDSHLSHMRVTLDGHPAPGFGSGPVNSYVSAFSSAVAVQPDGKAVVAGQVRRAGGGTDG